MNLKVIEKDTLDKFRKELIIEITSILQKGISGDMKKEWLTEKEAMQYLDVSKSTIQKYRLNGQLDFSQMNNKIYIKYADIISFLESNYTKKNQLIVNSKKGEE